MQTELVPTPRHDDANADSARRASGVRATWLYTLGSIVFFVLVLHAMALVFLVAGTAPAAGGLQWLVLALMVVSTVTVLRFCWFLERGLGSGLPGSRELVALFAPPVALWVVSLAEPPLVLLTAFPLWSAVNVVAALLSARARWMMLLGGGLAVVAHPVIHSILHPGPLVENLPVEPARLLPLTLYTVMLPLMVLGSLWWWQVVVRLDKSRRLAGDLAVAQERLRFAADLHDIQGHHLQVIALKAELAERLLEIDPATAKANLHETRLLARTALEETRSLVQGYRQVGLAEELANAADVLAAAGIDCRLHADATAAGPEQEHLLGLVVREATTNILRHSHANQTSINLSRDGQDVVLEICNDGLDRTSVPGPDARSATPAPAGPVTGTGLTGLRTRLADAGGILGARVLNDRFVLRAVLPAASHGDAG